MTDRELLELAAKAAGYTLAWSSVEGIPPRKAEDMETWSPLTDDGDALRLAAKLRIQICFSEPGEEHEYTWCVIHLTDTDVDDDCHRRAIVRAAAEIGRAMG